MRRAEFGSQRFGVVGSRSIEPPPKVNSAKIDWKQIECLAPYYMCRPLNWYGWDVYRKGWVIADSLNPESLSENIMRDCIVFAA